MTTTNNHRYLIAALILIATIGFLAAIWQIYNDMPKPAPPAQPAEQSRINKADSVRIRQAAYQERDNYYRPILKASERELANALSKYKPAKEKAHHSANAFVNSGTLEDCKVALSDCQEESTAAAVTIAKQDTVIAVQKAQRVNDSTEIVASHLSGQQFNAGWQKANEDNAVLTRKVKRKNKLLKIGGAIIAVLVGVVAVK